MPVKSKHKRIKFVLVPVLSLAHCLTHPDWRLLVPDLPATARLLSLHIEGEVLSLCFEDESFPALTWDQSPKLLRLFSQRAPTAHQTEPSNN